MGVAHVLAARGQVSPVLAQAAGGALPWWNPDGATPGGVGGSCVGAYQAKGAASYAASLANLANPGTYNLIEGNGAVPWTSGAGWGFVNAASQYFNTGIVPSKQYSIFVQYANSLLAGLYFIFSATNPGRVMDVRPNRGVAVEYRNEGTITVHPPLATGNLGFAGQQGYRNGIADGAPMADAATVNTANLFLGCYNNNGAPLFFITADIYAFVVYNTILTAPQVLARATAMAAI